jgi:hypothetical protein
MIWVWADARLTTIGYLVLGQTNRVLFYTVPIENFPVYTSENTWHFSFEPDYVA